MFTFLNFAICPQISVKVEEKTTGWARPVLMKKVKPLFKGKYFLFGSGDIYSVQGKRTMGAAMHHSSY